MLFFLPIQKYCTWVSDISSVQIKLDNTILQMLLFHPIGAVNFTKAHNYNIFKENRMYRKSRMCYKRNIQNKRQVCQYKHIAHS